VGRAKVRVQIDRLSLGNFGKCRFLKGGVGELKIAWGPAYRVYFATLNPKSVLLLCGGDKSSQQQDIRKAQEYWAEYRRRHNE
jgi:putative addiction module killer protein